MAPLCCGRSVNGVFFEGWFESQFLPCVPKGVMVILDGVSFHRREKLLFIAERVEVFLLFLSVYLPDFSRIECRWANLKCALPDLMPKCGALQEAVYTHFGECNY
ncbi:MAG: transposase [Nitrososphaerota archaeon]|nr:transposase [Nitrososphaerota archaeon]